jgi:AraC-like DNA-binding protein
LNSSLSLTDVAIDSGFYDLPHLDKAFRHRIGVSPQEYRSRYRPDHSGKTARGRHRPTQREAVVAVSGKRWLSRGEEFG